MALSIREEDLLERWAAEGHIAGTLGISRLQVGLITPQERKDLHRDAFTEEFERSIATLYGWFKLRLDGYGKLIMREKVQAYCEGILGMRGCSAPFRWREQVGRTKRNTIIQEVDLVGNTCKGEPISIMLAYQGLCARQRRCLRRFHQLHRGHRCYVFLFAKRTQSISLVYFGE